MSPKEVPPSTILPREYLVDLDVGVSDHHKVDFHTSDDAATDKRAQVPDQDVILVLTDAVVELYE